MNDDDFLRQEIAKGTMTSEIWDSVPSGQRERVRDNSALTQAFIGLEGNRVEVTRMNGRKGRFIIGKSTGWRPCHLEIRTRRSMGGVLADKQYQSVKVVELRARG